MHIPALELNSPSETRKAAKHKNRSTAIIPFLMVLKFPLSFMTAPGEPFYDLPRQDILFRTGIQTKDRTLPADLFGVQEKGGSRTASTRSNESIRSSCGAVSCGCPPGSRAFHNLEPLNLEPLHPPPRPSRLCESYFLNFEHPVYGQSPRFLII